MPKFTYAAKDSRGKEVKGSIEAANPAQVQELLKKQGLYYEIYESQFRGQEL